uniref:Homoserine dehydrogenase n=1 Tax=Aureoumbra lagunensis TaxID=44058 RepID=A0A7S3JYH8_9STRA|mmetsp:Transcript_5520/g.7778  ORF Transcript_5520/g.7778 Transcript_5520/m.7778 type:complete len:424 (+) Transcript_5520:51-1322(+)|eukprot:CAMPEP_0197289300 /NCGR_PEP_ID=MMETSP0890-20130614/6535_1 /TAXON_ID=44058 ORGANISM="Aureoumbra lagunensis, Strain CCMP1510" /NCGR_SAMPLE_ID=MMETSP0890 /ASSEMBLY_ACC=CAM_ASM_000533 /LENGTH=423 /DNA_ID=CAMNT_0042760615 /DNA_START=29 /DNA_END=1300 /DNA_ORIENTATION=+
MTSKLKIGLVGGGVVGGGTYTILTEKAAELCEITRVAVRDMKKPRDWKMASHTVLTDKWQDIVYDDSIQLVIEVAGGTGVAKEVVCEALKKGKHVVTANKALLATCLDELKGLVSPYQQLGYEAAVCGGIPIISTLSTHLAKDQVHSVKGIMNGTTNFMLSKMEAEGADYGQVLAQAQALGYAEADPTADVEGHDVCAKIAILAKLAFGITVPPEKVPTYGISKIQAVDFEYAKILNATVKLLGCAVKNPDNSIAVYVAPHVVANEHPSGFAGARGPTNAVSIVSDQLGIASLVGAGAGRDPTARSVVADVIRICHTASTQNIQPFPTPTSIATGLSPDFESAFYVRISAADQLGIIKSIGDVAEKRGVSINAVLQNPIKDPKQIAFVVTTDSVKFSSAQAFVNDVAQLPFATSPPVLLAILD